MEGPPGKKQRLEDPGKPVTSANKCINFHFAKPQSTDSKLQASDSFQPEFTHQIFGDDEEIHGFEGLEIKVWLLQPSFLAFVDVGCTLHRPDADDVDGEFRKHFPSVSFNRQDLSEKLTREAVTLSADQLGKPIKESLGTAIYHFNLSTAAQAIKDLHARIEPLLLFFVDAACAIDQEDADWDLMLAVRQHNGSPQVVGFCTVYNYYAWPDRKRLRLSQVLVWPPFQRQGLGRLLLQSVYTLADQVNCVDVTFEDPTDELQLLREEVDVERATASAWLPELAAKVAAAATSGPGDKENAPSHPGVLDLALPKDCEARARQELRLTKEQVRRVWEVLLFKQKAMQSERGVSMMMSLIAHRLSCNRENTKMAEGKRVVNGDGEGFVMMRFPEDIASRLPKSTEPEGHDGSTGAAPKESDIADMVETRLQELVARLG
ncbi:hypothetical protein WJX84_011581 [Apatococcus fuscideae]|uniref:histone acetyltransferase n=1 Tax=Apatococcus fuscideae TaxID=2026836 RepID=A0AAW1TBN4_9CHLO